MIIINNFSFSKIELKRVCREMEDNEKILKLLEDNEITPSNVDDFIRAKRKNGNKIIHWDKNGAKCFKEFVKITYYNLN